MMTPVRSLMQLETLARKDPRYRRLAILGASNLGGPPSEKDDLEGAMRWLRVNASDPEASEDGVIDEVNFCRDLVV